MRRTRVQNEAKRTSEILARLDENFPKAECALAHDDAYQLLVATILSAQCTDARVNKVTPDLFERYPDPPTLSKADPEELQDLIRSTGFFRNKSNNLLKASLKIVQDFDGEVPNSLEALIQLPGVARKTANVVLGTWFRVASGVVVDTHVGRISNRLGFTSQKDPVKIEKDLMKLLPKDRWISFAHQLILFGRSICKAQRPQCPECFLADLCPFFASQQA
jgi:endonuclease-3